MSSSRYAVNADQFQKLNAKLLYISNSLYEGDWQSIPHTHHFSELIYVAGGQGRFFIGGVWHPICAGDLIIVLPDSEHTEKSCGPRPLEYIVLGIEGITFKAEEENGENLICNYRNDPHLSGLLQLLLKEAEEEQEGAGLICQDLLEVLLIRISRMQKLLPSPFTADRMTKECSLIKRYLDSHFADPITLDSLAAMAHISKYYLVHAFSRHTGLSPISYLNHRRLETSKELLKTTDHSVAQISSLAGFSSQSYFAQVFKKAEGITPAQYRRNYLDSSGKIR